MKNVKYPTPCNQSGNHRMHMALRSLLMLLALTLSTTLRALPGNQQEEPQFTLSFVDAPLKDVLAEIEKDSEYTFVCKGRVNLHERVSFSVEKMNIEGVLTALLPGQGLSFNIDEKQIIVYRKEPRPFRQADVVKGTVTDGYGEPIAYASIQIKGAATGTTSDAKGEFELPVGGTVTLVISFDGQSMEIIAYPRQRLKVTLSETNVLNR